MPRAMRRLADQVAEHDGTAAEPSQPDGFGVYRVCVFRAPWLFDVLRANADPRIASYRSEGDVVEVTFVHDTRAEDARPYLIEPVLRILDQ